MDYVQVWFTAYVNPSRFACELEGKPAPAWGFFAAMQRALMDAFLLYLPMALMGRVPPERSYLAFVADERYYGALVLMAPIVLLAEWLLAGATMHLILRLGRFESDMDQILNITGFVALAIGSVLLLWDWIWIGLGGLSQYSLGISHLIIDVWGIGIAAIAFKQILKVPIWLGVLLNAIGVIVALPMAIMFMRSPL
jgi:hypothetical protein